LMSLRHAFPKCLRWELPMCVCVCVDGVGVGSGRLATPPAS